MTPIDKIASRLSKTSSYIYFGESRVSVARFEKEGINDCFPSLIKEMSLNGQERWRYMEISSKVLPKIKERKKGIAIPESATEEMESFIEHNIIFQSIADVKNLLVFNKDERKLISDIDPMVFLRRMETDKRKTFLLTLPTASVKYDAYSTKYLEKEKRYGVFTNYINLYRPPSWRLSFPDSKEEWLDTAPELFERFFLYLVPLEADRKAVLSWLCHAMTGRHHSFLVLRGNRGNGKTIFMKTMMAVIGDYYLALNGVVSDFNADLKNKRVVGIDDDTEIGSFDGNKLRKKLINTMVTYNEKHKQTKESEEQFASYILCSNPSDKFHVEYDERRVIQADLTKDKMNDHFTPEERNFLDTLAMSEDKLGPKQLEFLAQLGHYILNKSRNNPFNYDLCHKGGTFWKDVVESLNGFNRMVVDRILNREAGTYDFKELCYDWKEDKTNRQSVPSWTSFKHFIETFQYEDKSIAGKINNRAKSFKPSDYYTPESLEEIDPMELDI